LEAGKVKELEKLIDLVKAFTGDDLDFRPFFKELVYRDGKIEATTGLILISLDADLFPVCKKHAKTPEQILSEYTAAYPSFSDLIYSSIEGKEIPIDQLLDVGLIEMVDEFEQTECKVCQGSGFVETDHWCNCQFCEEQLEESECGECNGEGTTDTDKKTGETISTDQLVKIDSVYVKTYLLKPIYDVFKFIGCETVKVITTNSRQRVQIYGGGIICLVMPFMYDVELHESPESTVTVMSEISLDSLSSKVTQ
jgi:hypothetical protein